jgi:hypothetical protein
LEACCCQNSFTLDIELGNANCRMLPYLAELVHAADLQRVAYVDSLNSAEDIVWG